MMQNKIPINIALNKAVILKNWQDALLSSFPDETESFLNNPDPFLNPVGAMFPKMLETLYDQITGEMNDDTILSAMDDYIKLRAVQDSEPSRAFDFLMHLKKMLRSRESGSKEYETGCFSVNILEDRIDYILLKSFDMYMKCREKIYTLRINEFKKRAFRVLENVQ
jgi:hypothetical protein